MYTFSAFVSDHSLAKIIFKEGFFRLRFIYRLVLKCTMFWFTCCQKEF